MGDWEPVADTVAGKAISQQHCAVLLLRYLCTLAAMWQGECAGAQVGNALHLYHDTEKKGSAKNCDMTVAQRNESQTK